MRARLQEAGRGIRWYLRQASGEAKWDEYLERCTEQGRTPMTRREFERHRSEHRERNPRAGCC